MDTARRIGIVGAFGGRHRSKHIGRYESTNAITCVKRNEYVDVCLWSAAIDARDDESGVPSSNWR